MKKNLLFAAAAFLASPAFASNFSYTNIDVSIGKISLDEDLIFEGEVYEEFATFALSGSYQVNKNFAFGLGVSAFANDGPATEITGSAVVLSAAFPFAVSDRLDIVPSIGLLSTEIELCEYGWCYKDDESGVAYGVGLRAWAVPGAIEIMAGISDSTIEGSERFVSIGGALWWLNRHSLRLNYGADKDMSEVSLGYRYSW